MIAFLSFIIVFGIKVTAAHRSVVQTCPKTKVAWDQRSSMFTCVNNTKYHCVMDSTWTLVELCMTSLNISRNIGGCPTVYIFDSKGFWLFPFTPCPIQNNECPQESHGNYTSEQLFKYPACFLNKDEREINGTEFQQSTAETRVSTSNAHREELTRQDVAYIPYAFGTTLILIVFIFVLLCVQKRHTQNLFKKAMTKEPSKDIKEHEYANLAVPDLGTKKRSNNSFEADIKEDEYAHLPGPHYGTYTRSSNSVAVGGFTSRQFVTENIKEHVYTDRPAPGYGTEIRSNNSFEADIKKNEYAHLPVPDYGIETRSSNSFAVVGFTSRQKNWDIKENEYTNLPAPGYGTEKRSYNSFEVDIKENEYAHLPVPDYGIDTRSSNSFAVGGFTSRQKYWDLGGREFPIFSIPSIENKSQSSSSSKDDGSENVLIKHVVESPSLYLNRENREHIIPRKNHTVTLEAHEEAIKGKRTPKKSSFV